MVITEQTHPAIYDAFYRIDLDNGGINRYNPKRETYTIPDCFSGQVPQFEQQLAAMTPEKREEFCNGEHSDVQAIIKADGLDALSEFLNRFFDDWIEDAEDGR